MIPSPSTVGTALPRPVRVRITSAAVLLACLVFAAVPARPQKTGAAGQKIAAVNAHIIAWVNATLPKYHQYIQFARSREKPQVPIPPAIGPPCHVCGDKTQTQGEQQFKAWLKTSEEPESDDIANLMAISRRVTLYRGLGNELTPSAAHALAQFEDEDEFMADAGRLADRLLHGKAIPMAQKYDQDPKRAYAGIQFILASAKLAELTQGGNTAATDNEALGYAKNWAQSIVNQIDSDVLSGHKYNLCPVYADIYHMVAMLGGSADVSSNFEQIMQKMQQLMTFNVNFNLQVQMQSNDGTHLNATWTGDAKLKLNVDVNNSCYTPHWENGNKMAVNLTHWDMIFLKHNPDGSVQKIPGILTSPHQYDAKMQNAQVNLCDPQPIFQIPIANMVIPQEILIVAGMTSPASILDPFLNTVVGSNEFNSAPTNAATGSAPNLPGAISSSSPSSDDNSEMDKVKAEIDAHKGDVNWLMSPEGRAVLAKMQKMALAKAQGAMAKAGMVVPKSNDLRQLSATVNSAHLHWTNGQSEPVNQTLHFTKDGNSFVLTVTVNQAKQ